MSSPLDTQSSGAQARLVAISGPLSGEVLSLTAGGVRIGRDSSNDVCLPDLALSRTHCTIGTPDGTWRICDSQSSNGTFVNGVQVTNHQLNDRDRITLEEPVFLFVLNPHPATIPPLLERLIEPATRLPVDDTIWELENTIERAIVLGTSDRIMRDDLPDALLQRPASGDVEGSRFHDAVRQAKVGVIVEAVREAQHSYTEAARLLGLHPNYLHRLIRTLDMKSILEPDC